MARWRWLVVRGGWIEVGLPRHGLVFAEKSLPTRSRLDSTWFNCFNWANHY